MLSYNDVYETLRREKYGETLQQLPKGFIIDFADYIASLKEISSKEDDLFMDNVIKSKKQLENSIAMFKELMRLRKKKLLSLVFVATETGIMKRDYENMLDVEKLLFDRVIKSFEDSDKEVSQVFMGRKEKNVDKFKMILFNQQVDQFVDMSGNIIGPFNAGQVANLETEVCEILVSGGKASFVDES